MLLTVNGAKHDVEDGVTGAQLLEFLTIAPATVVVELNAVIVQRDEFLTMSLKDGDSLELVTLVGGG